MARHLALALLSNKKGFYVSDHMAFTASFAAKLMGKLDHVNQPTYLKRDEELLG